MGQGDTGSGGGMAPLEYAQDEALQVVERLRRSGNPARRTVYVMRGCDCAEMGGRRKLYHVHALTDDELACWQAQQADAGPVATFAVPLR